MDKIVYDPKEIRSADMLYIISPVRFLPHFYCLKSNHTTGIQVNRKKERAQKFR